MKKGEKKSPEIAFNPFDGLTPKEKEVLRGILTNPTFVKLLNMVERFRPSSNCSGAGSKERDNFSNDRANARLGEMRGWDLRLTAMFAILSETAMKKLQVEANYPDSGRFDAKFGEIPSPDRK